MNIEAALTSVARTGDVSFGTNSVLKNMMGGKGRLVIISENCASETYGKIKQYSGVTNIPVFVFKGSSNDLGTICKKPFPISAMTIFEQGDSNILDVIK